jgi:hypothetical protein
MNRRKRRRRRRRGREEEKNLNWMNTRRIMGAEG